MQKMINVSYNSQLPIGISQAINTLLDREDIERVVQIVVLKEFSLLSVLCEMKE